MPPLAGDVWTRVDGPVRALSRIISRSRHLPETFIQGEVMTNGVLPANASVFVVGEVVADPAVDLAERHLLGRGGVDGVGDQRGVAVARLPVLVHRRLVLAQGGIGVCRRAWGALPGGSRRACL